PVNRHLPVVHKLRLPYDSPLKTLLILVTQQTTIFSHPKTLDYKPLHAHVPIYFLKKSQALMVHEKESSTALVQVLLPWRPLLPDLLFDEHNVTFHQSLQVLPSL